MESKTYRFNPQTLTQIEWLQQRFYLSATDVIRKAVKALHDQEYAKLPAAQLVESEDGGYTLVASGQPVLGVGPGAVADLPEQVRDDLFAGTAAVGDAFTYLILCAARVNEKVRWNRWEVGDQLIWGGKDEPEP